MVSSKGLTGINFVWISLSIHSSALILAFTTKSLKQAREKVKSDFDFVLSSLCFLQHLSYSALWSINAYILFSTYSIYPCLSICFSFFLAPSALHQSVVVCRWHMKKFHHNNLLPLLLLVKKFLRFGCFKKNTKKDILKGLATFVLDRFFAISYSFSLCLRNSFFCVWLPCQCMCVSVSVYVHPVKPKKFCQFYCRCCRLGRKLDCQEFNGFFAG